MTHKEAKSHIRAFMQAHYTDERLSWLLAHARSGKFAFASCCCFIGIPTADHALRSLCDWHQEHYVQAHQLGGSFEAEQCCYFISRDKSGQQRTDKLIRILIPMVLAEMRRRDRRMDELARKMLAEVDREELAKRPGSWPL